MKTDIISSQKFPEFFREEFPNLINFVEAYYKYIEDYTFNGRISDVKDLDLVDSMTDDHRELFIEHYKNQYAIEVPDFKYMTPVEFLRNAALVYSTRGTEKCLKFLFRAAYGEEISVYYPKFNMLRASESTWEQYYHIRVARIDQPSFFQIQEGDILTWDNSKGSYQIVVSSVTVISDTDSLVYFRSFSKIHIETTQNSEQKVALKRAGVQVYVGEIKKTLSSIQISVPGKFWQKGTVFRIKGDKADTIVKISEVGKYGSVVSAEIIQYGFDHEENAGVILSPFKSKPPTANIDITSDYVQISANPVTYAYQHTINISDSTDGFDESMLGESSLQTYYLSNYYESYPGYYGSIVLSKILASEKFENFESGESVSIEDWLESRTTFVLKFDYLVRGIGRFVDTSGIISNPNSVLQDSKYYQSFSYVIETEKSYNEAESIIKFNHPSGTKMFVETTRDTDIKFGINMYRQKPNDYLYIEDETTIEDSDPEFDK